MKNHLSGTAMAVVLALPSLSAAASAQDMRPGTLRPDTSFTVGDIVVTARGIAGNTGAVLTSVDRLGGDIAQSADVRNIYEIIARMPGIQLTEFNQGTTNGKFSLRGFNGEGNVNAVKLLIDGIPVNANDGNMPYIDMVFPLNVAEIEVVRGTSDPRYGLHAIAGSANIITRSGGTYVDARASAGSYDTFEGQFAAGVEHGGFTQNYQIAWRESSGFRDHSDTQRLSLSGRWGVSLNDDVQVGAIARYYEAEAQEPGYLTLVDARANPRMTNAYNLSDGDTRDMQQYALTADIAFSDRLDWTSAVYLNRLRDDRSVKFSAGSSQQRRLTAEDHLGAQTSLHWHGDFGSMMLMLEAGGDIQWQDNRSARWLSVARVPTSQTRDQQFDLNVGGAYVQAILEPAEWLRITPAWRIDWVGGGFANRLHAATASINDYGRIDQPKLSVAVLPAAGFPLYANWGRTFQIGLGSGAYLIAPRLVDLAPSMNEGWELGARYSAGGTFAMLAAYWEQSATGEIARRLNDPLGDFENVGATDRRGMDVRARIRPVAGLSLWGALSWQEAVIAVPPAGSPLLVGNELNHTPHWLWSGSAEYQPVQALTLRLSARGQSDYFLTTGNTEGKWGRLAVLDASIDYRLNNMIVIGMAARNLTNSRSEYVWWDGVQSLHSPAPGRNVTASVRVSY